MTTEKDVIKRHDFWATTSNKQLDCVQHTKTLLRQHGRAAVVLPDTVLFEGGAGETIGRQRLHGCDVHRLLRLPIGLFSISRSRPTCSSARIWTSSSRCTTRRIGTTANQRGLLMPTRQTAPARTAAGASTTIPS